MTLGALLSGVAPVTKPPVSGEPEAKYVAALVSFLASAVLRQSPKHQNPTGVAIPIEARQDAVGGRECVSHRHFFGEGALLVSGEPEDVAARVSFLASARHG